MNLFFCWDRKPNVCLCEDAIQEDFEDPDAEAIIRACTLNHERSHEEDIDCSKCSAEVGPCTEFIYHDPCGADCTECKAWRDVFMCLMHPTAPVNQEVLRWMLREHIIEQMLMHCNTCDASKMACNDDTWFPRHWCYWTPGCTYNPLPDPVGPLVPDDVFPIPERYKLPEERVQPLGLGLAQD